MGQKVPFEVDLSPDREAPRQARQLLGRCFADELTNDELEWARLLTSELVTNAVVHGHGTIKVRGNLDEDRLLVEVIDQGSGFERAADKREFSELGGRGLHIVEAASSRWGIHEGTTHVWFELERVGPRVGEGAKPDPS